MHALSMTTGARTKHVSLRDAFFTLTKAAADPSLMPLPKSLRKIGAKTDSFDLDFGDNPLNSLAIPA
jgi:hypothetical protein